MKFLVALVSVVAVSAAAPQQFSVGEKQRVALAVAQQPSNFGDQRFFQNQLGLYGNPNLYQRSSEHRFLSQQQQQQQQLTAYEQSLQGQQLLRYPQHAYQRSGEAAAEVLEHDSQMQDPGHYSYHYRTNNGIEVAEQAALGRSLGPEGAAENVQGQYSWVAPSGEKFTVEYVADESGFHPRGAHIPEIPPAIARALEWNAAHPEQDPEARKWDRQYQYY